LGKQIKSLTDTEFSPGSFQLRWDAASETSGIYFVRMEADDVTESRKVLLIK